MTKGTNIENPSKTLVKLTFFEDSAFLASETDYKQIVKMQFTKSSKIERKLQSIMDSKVEQKPFKNRRTNE